ncbi:zinc finger SWIM domain-containing protein 7-like [Prorops nasuta]|uniref:zinc finger SWIM domain-containing protein 7-like n=1 Tax=Prorops nasuta TaxID=863751 RepID=UPI0034CEBC12
MDVSTTETEIDDKLLPNLYHREYAVFVDHALQEITGEFEKDKRLSDKTLLNLYNLFGETFERGLELYEQNRITGIITSNSTSIGISKERTDARWLLQVKGFSGETYTIFPNINFCNCQAFRSQVLNKRTSFTCKHVLAVWLASLDKSKLEYKEVTHQQFQDLLQYLFSNKS